MATSSSGTDTRDPWDVPSRVAIETPQGDIRAGDVVDSELRVDETVPRRWVLVNIEGSQFWARLDETQP